MTLEVKPVLPRFFFDLLGRSIILLCNLIPRTLYIAYVTSGTAQKYCDVAEVFKCIMPRLVDCILLVGRRSDPLLNILKFQCFVISGLLLEKLASTAAEVWENGKEVLNSASPQLLLGLATGLTSSLLLLRFSARIVRERRITWQVE